MTSKKNFSEIKEVKTVLTDAEANELLASGWVLLSTASAHIDELGYNAKIHYVLGKMIG